MNIVLFGDSITDMGRDRTTDCLPFSLGMGYPFFIAGELKSVDPNRYTVYNRGIGGNRIVDLYARIKADVWNLKPDVLSILIGVNDIWHELDSQNGVDIERWEKVYRMILEDTKKRLPDCKIVLCEPFVLKGSATQEKYDGFLSVKIENGNLRRFVLKRIDIVSKMPYNDYATIRNFVISKVHIIK